MSAPIEVLEVHAVTGHGNLRAFAKVKLGCVVIHGCRVIREEGKRPWVAFPQVPARKKADGSGAGWFPVLEITNRAVMDQLRAAVLEQWERSGRMPPPHRGQRTYERAKETAEAWSKEQSDRRVQELADQFDRRPPDEVPF